MSLTKVTYSMIDGAPFNVSDYGAIADGSTDSTSAIQAAVNAAAVNGGIVYFEAGTYIVTGIALESNVSLIGVYGKTILKVKNGVDAEILSNTKQYTGPLLQNILIENIIFDGNQANAPRTVATSAVSISSASYVTIKNCTFKNGSGYGFAAQGQQNFGSWFAKQTDYYFENCYFIDNGVGTASGGDTYDGIDIKMIERCILVNCHASGNVDAGVNIRGTDVSIIGGSCYDNLVGYLITDNPNGDGQDTTCLISGANAYSNRDGFVISQTTVASTKFVKCALVGVASYNNTQYGVASESFTDYVDVTVTNSNIYDNGSHGVYPGTQIARSYVISDSVITGNTGSGVATIATAVLIDSCELSSNTRYGYEELGTGTRSQIGGATRLLDNGLGSILLSTNKRLTVGNAVKDYLSGAGDIIASASTITLPQTGQFFNITGTTNIDTISDSWRGRQIVLFFNEVLTLGDLTGNLALAGDFTTSSNDTLKLIYTGTLWAEVCRSVN